MAKVSDFDPKTSLDDTDILWGGSSPFGSGDDFKVTFANLVASVINEFPDASANPQTVLSTDSLVFYDASAASGSEAATTTVALFTSGIITPAAEAAIAAASVKDLSDFQDTAYSNGQVPVWSTANSRFEPGTGGGDDTEGYLDALSPAALEVFRRNAAGDDYEFADISTELDAAVADAEDAAEAAWDAADEIVEYLPADYVRLSDTLTLNGSTDQYTAFKALIETAHTKKKIIIFDGMLALDLSAGAITPGGPQEWVTEKADYTQGITVLGVVTTGLLTSIHLTSPLELGKFFYIDGSGVTATNRTALPNGSTLFSIGAGDIVLRGKLIGVLNESGTATTGTGLSLAKATTDADYENFTIENAEITDWWRVYFSDNGDEGVRDDFKFRDLDITNIGRDAIVVNAPGATTQNTDILFEDVRLHDISVDRDGSVGLGAAGCRRVTFNKIGFSGYCSVGLSFEEMDIAQVSDVYGEVDHSLWSDKTQALIHVKANNVSTGSYIANEQVQINGVTVKQVGDLTGITNSNGIQFSGNSGASVDAVNDFEGNNISLEGFKRGIWDANESDSYSPLRWNNVSIRAGSATGAGVYGVYANQINAEWKNFTIGGCQVGARGIQYSQFVGWHFVNCLDPIAASHALGGLVVDCKWTFTGQTIPGSSNLVVKFLPLYLGSSDAWPSISGKFVMNMYSLASTQVGMAVYEMFYTNAGSVTGDYPPGAVPSGSPTYTLGSTDQLITVRSGVGSNGTSYGPGNAATDRGLHLAATNHSSPVADGCLGMKIEKGSAGDITAANITIMQSGGAALLQGGASLDDMPS